MVLRSTEVGDVTVDDRSIQVRTVLGLPRRECHQPKACRQGRTARLSRPPILTLACHVTRREDAGGDKPRWGQRIDGLVGCNPRGPGVPSSGFLRGRLPACLHLSISATRSPRRRSCVETPSRFLHGTSTWLRTMTQARVGWDTGRRQQTTLADLIAAEVACAPEAVKVYMRQLGWPA